MHKLDETKQEFEKKILEIKDLLSLDKTKNYFLGKKGSVTLLLKDIKDLSIEEKKVFGLKVNQLKIDFFNKFKELENLLKEEDVKKKLNTEYLDTTISPRVLSFGSIHPMTKAIQELQNIFQLMGFISMEGPEIETDWYNFESLNVPKNHPARQMQDTFYMPSIDSINYVLRTQTTAVTARNMCLNKPPFKFISIGKTFRNDFDATHLPMFHQIDAVYLDKNITMANLKSILIEFCKFFFDIKTVPLRFRPSFFPFTSPSIEIDIKCTKQNGKIIKFGEGEDWCEILGGGMLHPNVIKNANIDPNSYTAFAFGTGIERLAMLKYGIADMRYLYSGDIRFLNHYSFKSYEQF